MPEKPVKPGRDEKPSTRTESPGGRDKRTSGEMPPTVVLRSSEGNRQLPLAVGDLPREIPVRLGKYRIEAVVGRGAMGVVYKAIQPDLNRIVALKLLLEGQHASESRKHRFEREARSIAKLKHPNIVVVHEVGDYEGQPFFTMDFIDGQPLDNFIEWNGIASTTLLAELCVQIADAVHYAHEKGIVHRDLKPGNILVTREGRPIVTDFGLAKDLQTDTMFSITGDIMGTPAYMSPEQAEGQVADLDYRSDIYSLGAILYTMLTGKPPFEGKTLVETLGRVINDDPAPLHHANPAIEGDLGSICIKAMEKSPGNRYGSARELADDLRRFINGEPVLAQPWTWRRNARRVFKKRRRELTITGIAVVGIILAALVSPRFFSRSYLDIAAAHLASNDLVVQAKTVAALGLEIVTPDQLDPGRVQDAAALLWTALYAEDQGTQKAFLEQLAHLHVARPLLDAMSNEDVVRLLYLVRGSGSESLRNRTIEALARVRRPETTAFLIEALEQESNPSVKNKIIRSLGAHYSAQAIKPLMRVLIYDPVCRPEAQIALDMFHVKGKISLFKDQDDRVKGSLQNLNRALAQYNQQLEDAESELADGEKADNDPIIAYRNALVSGTTEEKLVAVIELKRAGNEMAHALLIDALGDEDAGLAAAYALQEANPDLVLPRLREILADSSPQIRGHAALAIGLLNRPDMVDDLLVALRNESEVDTSEAIVSALAELGRPEAVPGLRYAADQDPRLGPAVRNALKRIGAEPREGH